MNETSDMTILAVVGGIIAAAVVVLGGLVWIAIHALRSL